MKSRAIQTRFWDDEVVADLEPKAKYLFIYLLTCQYINVSGAFQLPDKKIIFETGLSKDQLDSSKSELTKYNKVRFMNGWVFVVNAEKDNNYTNIPSNKKTYDNEWDRVPKEVKEYFKGKVDGSVTGQRPVINNKPKIENNKPDVLNTVDYNVAQVLKHYQTVYKLKSIRNLTGNTVAAHRLIDEQGLENTLQAVTDAYTVKKKPYFPMIMNLIDLDEKFDKLQSQLARDEEENPKPKKESSVIRTATGKIVK